MAFAIGGEYDIRKMNEDSFEAAAKEAGLGRALAMDRFRWMSSAFEKALLSAKKELEGAQNASEFDDICERILSVR